MKILSLLSLYFSLSAAPPPPPALNFCALTAGVQQNMLITFSTIISSLLLP